jgi:chemotaxis protein MotB
MKKLHFKTLKSDLPNMRLLFVTCMVVFSCAACVKKKVYKTELTNRQLSEAREKVLISELTDRKTEAEKMIKSIGDLNKTVGKQEGDIAELRGRIVQLSNSANQTTTSLLDEKNTLEKNLKEKTKVLFEKEALIERISDTQKERIAILSDLNTLITSKFSPFEGVTIATVNDYLLMTIPDKLLFENTGININTTGKMLLDSLSKVLTNQPSLETQIITYTDNQLPKNNKSLVDTWDWSLKRATILTRSLITDYGVNANQLSPIGRGEFYPLATNETPEGRQQNRRTEIIFKPKLKAISIE